MYLVTSLKCIAVLRGQFYNFACSTNACVTICITRKNSQKFRCCGYFIVLPVFIGGEHEVPENIHSCWLFWVVFAVLFFKFFSPLKRCKTLI